MPTVAIPDVRFRPPPLRKGIVSRSALVERTGLSQAGVVGIFAPPGYGKSTLLAQLARDDPRPTAWAALDTADRDPAAFFGRIAACLSQAIPVDEAVFSAIEGPTPADDTALEALARSVASAPEPFFLGVDDVHLICETDGERVLDRLLRHVPPGSQVALAGRQTPSVGLPRLMVEGVAVGLSAEDLRLDEKQASELLKAAGARFSHEQVSVLLMATEGWPAGLYLAALGQGGAGESDGVGGLVSGNDRQVADYLRSEILDRLPEEQVAFLTRASVLDEMDGPLCDAVLQTTGSAVALEEIEASNLLLVPLDRERERYRYHHLLRDLLARELDLREPGIRPVLAARASEHCERSGRIEAAIDYAVAADDAARVTLLVTFVGMYLFQSGRMATLNRWLDWLEARGTTDVTVAVLAAWLHILAGEAVEAERWADVAERADDEGVPPGGGAGQGWRLALRAAMARDGVAQMGRDARAALDLLPPGSPMRPTAMVLTALGDLFSGDADAADVGLAQSAEDAIQIGAMPAAVIALSERAMIAVERGQWTRSRELSSEATALIREHRLEGYAAMSLAFAIAARVAVHSGEVHAASRALGAAERLRPLLTRVMPYAAVQLRCQLARGYLGVEEPELAEQRLAEADEILRRVPDLGTLISEVAETRELARAAREARSGRPPLSPAERRLLPQLVTHRSFREIADELHLSPHTIKAEATSIYRKLGVSARGDAISRARALGLLDP